MSESNPRPGRGWGKLLLPILVVVSVAAGGLAWRSRQSGPADLAASAQPAPVERPIELASIEVTRMKARRLTDTVRLSGSVAPLNQTALKSEVAARLVEVPVREGQSVKRGEVLARFDTLELTARLNEKLSNLEGAKAQLVLAEKTRSKNLALRQKDIVAETSLDQAQSTFQFQQSQVAALTAQVELARKSLRDAVVLSPIDGMVAQRSVNPGDYLAVNVPLFVVVDLSRVEVEATVPADDVARLRPGQSVALRVEGFGDRNFPGRVARINPMTRAGSRAIPVYVDVDNADGALRGGMFASGDVLVAEAERAFAVPPVAVRHDERGDFVLAIVGDRLERREVVRRGLWSRGDLVQIDGVTDGDLVVTANLPGLTAGRPVKIMGS